MTKEELINIIKEHPEYAKLLCTKSIETIGAMMVEKGIISQEQLDKLNKETTDKLDEDMIEKAGKAISDIAGFLGRKNKDEE